MQLAEFVESLILAKFECIPEGHVRLNPSVHPEIPRNIGEARQIGFVGVARFYADPGVPEGQARFIDAEGRITILIPSKPITVGTSGGTETFQVLQEEKPVEQKAPAKKPGKKKVPRKRKARSVRTRSPKTDRV